MRFITRLGLLLIIGLHYSTLADAQSSNPAAAKAVPVTVNFDVFPNSTTYNEGRRVVDADGLGLNGSSQRQEFVILGMDENSGGDFKGCGPIKTIVSRNGIEKPKTGAYLADDGYDFFQQAAILGSSSLQAGFGFFCGVGSDETSGAFVATHNIYGMEMIVNMILNPGGHPFANFGYINNAGRGADDFALFQRYDRTGAKVSNMTYGRNIPWPHHESPTVPVGWPTASARTRTAGGDVLSNGNAVFVIADRTEKNGVGPADYYGISGDKCQVFTIVNPAADAYINNTTNVFRRSNNTTLEDDNSQGTAAGAGFWANLADDEGGSLAVFKNDGSRVYQKFGVANIYNASPEGYLGSPSRLLSLVGSKSIAAASNMIYIAARYYDIFNPALLRPCILRFKVDMEAPSDKVAPLMAFIADDDYTSPPALSVELDDMDIAANNDGFVAICWRKRDLPGYPPVARVFVDDTAATGSFFVSSIASPSNDSGYRDYFTKVALSGNDFMVVWESVNGVESLGQDCYTQAKPVATIGRVFEVTKPLEVSDWDLY